MDESDQWSKLYPDLLNEIVKRIYCYDDYVRLRCVCKQWNLELSKTSNHPWLLLPFGDGAFKTDGLGEKQIYHFRLPEMQSNLLRGSCHGWLIIVMISDGAVQMLNPYTKAHFYLPPISTFPDVVAYQPDEHGEEYTLRDPDGSTYTVERIRMHKSQFHKIVISSAPDNDRHEFMAAAIYGDYGRLAFCRLGDRGWTDVPTAEIQLHFEDVVFHAGKIYAIDWKAQMYEFDMKEKPLPMRVMSEATPPRDLGIENAYLNIKYLAARPDGGLLMLVRHLKHIPLPDGSDKPNPYRTYKFDIFALSKDGEPVWSRVYGLGNYVLMLGLNSSVWMLPHTFLNGKGNLIYYTDNHELTHFSQRIGGHDIGVLNVEDGVINQLFPDVAFLCPPPLWMLPY